MYVLPYIDYFHRFLTHGAAKKFLCDQFQLKNKRIGLLHLYASNHSVSLGPSASPQSFPQ